MRFFLKNKNDRIPNQWLRFFEPRLEFKRGLKIMFLGAIHERFPKTATLRFVFALRVLTFILVCMATISGTAAYADITDASPMQQILYPLKRYAELVRTTVTPSESQPQLHLDYARRRLLEIEKLSVQYKEEGGVQDVPREPRLRTLVRDLNTEVKTSVVGGEKLNSKNRMLSACLFLDEASTRASSVIERVMMEDSFGSARAFWRECGRDNLVPEEKKQERTLREEDLGAAGGEGDSNYKESKMKNILDGMLRHAENEDRSD